MQNYTVHHDSKLYYHLQRCKTIQSIMTVNCTIIRNDIKLYNI